jgi:hypothetical protein
MRRIAAGLGLLALAGGLLAGCGPAAVSYNDGFAVGTSVAAASAHGSLDGRAAVLRCRQQWRTSGPAADDRRVWIAGCVAGVRKLDAAVG